MDIHKFVKIGPQPLNGRETGDEAMLKVDRMEQCFVTFNLGDNEKLITSNLNMQGIFKMVAVHVFDFVEAFC